MLLFSKVQESPIPEISLFPDHIDASLLYYLPGELVLAETSAGGPDFFLLRYRSDFSETEGGLLRMSLRLKPPAGEKLIPAEEDGWNFSTVIFDEGHIRLRLRSPLESDDLQVGTWHRISLAGGNLITAAVNLSTDETQLLRNLIQDSDKAVEVVLHLEYRGLVQGVPWLVTADREALGNKIASTLGYEPVRSDEVVAAFLSLPETGLIDWKVLEPDTPDLTREAILTETALRSLEVFFERDFPGSPAEPTMYRLLPGSADGSEAFTWDLRTLRLENRSHVVEWSISKLYRDTDDEEIRQRMFPVVTQVNPFENVDVYIVNHLPFDNDYLRKVKVDLRFPGPSGVLEHRGFTFTGQKDVERFSTIYSAMTMSFNLDYRITCTLAPPGGTGWPITWKRDFSTSKGPVVEINRKTSGMDFVQVEAEEKIFEKTTSIKVELFSRVDGSTPNNNDETDGSGASSPSSGSVDDDLISDGTTEPVPGSGNDSPDGGGANGSDRTPLAGVILTQEKPAAWVVLPGTDTDAELDVLCTANPPDGSELMPYVLLDVPLIAREVKIAAYRLEVLESDPIKITMDSETAARFAYVAVALISVSEPETEEGKLYTLQPGEQRTWNLYRKSVFESILYRYRIHYVAYDTSGNTLPMTVTDWITTGETSLSVCPPVLGPEEPQ